ncbi:unnamed protein product, partial [marine sediment metagenome]
MSKKYLDENFSGEKSECKKIEYKKIYKNSYLIDLPGKFFLDNEKLIFIINTSMKNEILYE